MAPREAQPGGGLGRLVRALAVALAVALVVAACGSPSPTMSNASLPTGPAAVTSVQTAAVGSPSADVVPSISAEKAAATVTAFFYPWYGTPAVDGKWIHWNQLQHNPPDNIASSYYPARGPYSSADPTVLREQMAELRAARIGVISVSWHEKGSIQDANLPVLFAAAAAAGVKIAFHIEPSDGQDGASIVADIHYLLAQYGSSPALQRVAIATSGDASSAARPVFYLFASSRLAVADLRAAIAGLRGTPDDAVILLHSPKAITATRVGADGVYTYDALVDPASLTKLIGDCKAANLLCSPSVAPGFDNRNAVATGQQVVERDDGARYDAMWQAALGAGPDWISITSFNEWHEGTQIEPARVYTGAGRTYLDFDGAYGTTGADAQSAYLARTAYWVAKFDAAALARTP